LSANLRMRFLSAAVLVPIVLVAVFRGGWWLFGIVLILVVLATREYVEMLRRIGLAPVHTFAAILSLFVVADLYSDWRPAVAGSLLASLCWHVVRDRSVTSLQDWLLPIAGALYISLCAGYLILLRGLDLGANRLFLVVLATVAADTGAYFVGRAWGRRLLLSRLSPKKTWEGAVGGLVAAGVVSPIAAWLTGIGWVHGLALGLLLAIAAPFGDLGISMIKRQVGVKDTGGLIPGHGGALDRLDSILVTAVVGYYYYLWVGGAVPGG